MRLEKIKQNLATLLLSIAPLSACYETAEITNPAYLDSDVSRYRNDSGQYDTGFNQYDTSELRDLPEQYYPEVEEETNDINRPSWQYVNKCERDNLIRTDNNHLCERVTYHFNAQASAVLVRNHDINGVVDPCSEIIAFPPTGISGILNGDSHTCYITIMGLPTEECYCNEGACSESEDYPGWLQCGKIPED